MTDDLRKDRAMGAIMGTLIGDALGMGCHWYYDIEAQVRDYGDWISDYHDCKPERKDVHGKVATLRHELGVRAGDVSQTGQFVVMLMESVAEKGTYDEADYTARLDEFLKTIDGTPFSGRYTDRAIVDVWHNRKAGIPWSDAGSITDTPEAAIRAVVLAARSSGDPVALAIEGESNIHLTHKNPYITGSSLAYAMATEAFIQGVPLSGIRKYMSALKNDPETRDRTCSNDVRFQVGNEGAVLGADLSLNLDPVIVTRLFGMNCVLGFMLPATYFLIHRYPDDFEMAVLTAVNAGGNNMGRAAIVGGISGAMVGLKAIPERFIAGLKDHERLLDLAEKVADQGAQVAQRAVA